MQKKTIRDKRFGFERALYATENAIIENCRFEGEEDGESAMKECRGITVRNCYMALRYPLWHVSALRIEGGEMTSDCRAALWYSRDIEADSARFGGIKALRDCTNAHFSKCDIISPEFGWQSEGITLSHCDIVSEYAFLHSSFIKADNITLGGKYTFQYTENVEITDSVLKTKDAFWHAKNVTVTDSTVEGEYLGWYSENLTFVRCHIKGTQPLCYCKNLRLIDCTCEDCDLAFEYSDVEAEIKGGIDSIKNPRSGHIKVGFAGEVLRTEDSVYPSEAEVIVTGENGGA